MVEHQSPLIVLCGCSLNLGSDLTADDCRSTARKKRTGQCAFNVDASAGNIRSVMNAALNAVKLDIGKIHAVKFDSGRTQYPASKFAVNGLTVSLARELGPKGIRVNAVAPGITLTDMMKAVPKEVIDPLIKQIPLRRLGQPEDIANAFVFLASDEASYITGVVLSVDGMART